MANKKEKMIEDENASRTNSQLKNLWLHCIALFVSAAAWCLLAYLLQQLPQPPPPPLLLLSTVIKPTNRRTDRQADTLVVSSVARCALAAHRHTHTHSHWAVPLFLFSLFGRKFNIKSRTRNRQGLSSPLVFHEELAILWAGVSGAQASNQIHTSQPGGSNRISLSLLL